MYGAQFIVVIDGGRVYVGKGCGCVQSQNLTFDLVGTMPSITGLAQTIVTWPCCCSEFVWFAEYDTLASLTRIQDIPGTSSILV